MKIFGYFLLLVGTMVMAIVMAKTGETLKTKETPGGILNLEFAYSIAKTEQVTNAWVQSGQVNNIENAKKNTYYDFLFIFCYAGFLYFSCKKIASLLSAKMGFAIAKGVLIAGLFDVLENLGMLITLSGYRSEKLAMFTVVFSTGKWTLIAIAVVYLATGFIMLLAKRKFLLLFR